VSLKPTHDRIDGDRSPVAIVIDAGYDQHTIEEEILSPFGFEVIERPCHGDARAVVEAVRGADAVLVRESPITAEAMDGMPDCRVIVRYGVGVDNIDRDAAAARKIYVANVPDYGVEEVSDHALALFFAVTRRIASRDRDVRQGAWNVSRAEPIFRIAGRTLGIIGYGRTGAAMLRKCSMLGFAEMLVHDTSTREFPYGAQAASLDELIERADVISLHVPLTPATKGMISRERIFKMRAGSVIINTARGGLIDEEALCEAMHTGHLAGAGIDVYAKEPPSLDNPLFSAPNVALTDHMAWYSEQSVAELQTKAAQEVARVFAGGVPKNWVNRWE
jgi:D-3-phosphoglycerate dehydrogenase